MARRKRSKGPSARDRAEVGSGKGSARDRAEVVASSDTKKRRRSKLTKKRRG
jgi:hypothetical protein